MSYKEFILKTLEEKDNEISFNELYSLINKEFPNNRKSGSQYLREVLTNRYKGSEYFYISNEMVGLKYWNDKLSDYRVNKKYIEGSLKEVSLLTKTRNQKVVRECKERDSYTCQSCSFYYNGKIVEAHHLSLVSDSKEREITIDDLITLCPNCHKIAYDLINNKLFDYKNRDTLLNLLREELK